MRYMRMQLETALSRGVDIRQWSIWNVDFGSTLGKEQSGQRPAILIKEFEDHSLCIMIPLTSQLDAERFKYTVKINKTSSTNLRNDSIALLYQMKSISSQRLGRSEIGVLADYQIEKVKGSLRDMMQLQQS